MKERPISFKPEMVRAILEGRKTQTRRTRGLERVNETPNEWEFEGRIVDSYDSEAIGNYCFLSKESGECVEVKCPYGEVGDRLWVKEPYVTVKADSKEERESKFKAAQKIDSMESLMKYCEMPSGGGPVLVLYKSDYGEWADNPDSDLGPWKNSMYMPRWACRLVLEITDIRLELVQDITEEDAIAEGIEQSERTGGYVPGNCAYATWAFRELWDSIHYKDGYEWGANPWVWAISFKRVEAEPSVT